MSAQRNDAVRRITAPEITARKGGEPLVCLTAYSAPMAEILDPHCDVLLVGDSVGTTCLGFPNTLPVTVPMIAHHLDAVMRAAPRALVVADMPFLSYHVDLAETVRNAGDLARRGAGAVKVEGGAKRVEAIGRIIDAEIPVMGHLGLTPQSFNMMGGHKVQARKGAQVARILDDACALEEAGCFALVLEGVPFEVAEKITNVVRIPTIGIGAGAGTDGQVLVLHDMLDVYPGKKPRFTKNFMAGAASIQQAVGHYVQQVKSGAFPAAEHGY